MGLSVQTNSLSPTHLNMAQDALSLSLYHQTLTSNLNSGIMLSVEPSTTGNFIVSEVSNNKSNANNNINVGSTININSNT